MKETYETRFLFNLVGLSQRLVRKAEGSLSVHGLSFTELLILHQLYSSESQCLPRVHLAEAVGISASGVTRLLLPMEKVGLISKQANPRDARVSLVKLTAAGQRIYTEAMHSLSMFTKKFSEVLPAEKLEGLREQHLALAAVTY